MRDDRCQMTNKLYLYFICILLIVSSSDIFGQTRHIIRGKVIDADNGDPVPFANVYFKNSTTGATTDFQGYYELTTSAPGDTLVASYIGYITQEVLLVLSSEPIIINYQLREDIVNLQEVVFFAGENPAFPIMRNVIKNKSRNDKRNLDAYEYETYTKIEIDIDNLSENFKSNNKIMRQISQVLDSIEVIAGENGKPVLPIFISEAISKFYYKKNPRFRYENIIKTKMSGIGITDGTLTSQVIGSTFQEYNFYQNWLNIVEKEFISPIADGWKANYEYDLVDSLYLGDFYCYRLDVFPKREHDLAFRGTIWIDKETYALKQVDLSIDRKANLNWIEKLKIQQELEPTTAGAWMPVKTRVLVDIGEVTKDMAGLLTKFYVSVKDIKVNVPHEDSFYRLPLVMEEDVRMFDGDYWSQHRHDSLSSTEINVFQMIDTLKTIPTVKTAMDIAKFVASGYYKIGKLDLGPWVVGYTANDVEGFRPGFGMRTNINFSRKWIFKGTVGYGFKDEAWKYTIAAEYLINRRPWTKIGVETRKEIDQVFILTNDISNNSLFYAYTRFGELTKPFLSYTNRIYFKSQIGTGLTQKIFLKNGYFEPLYDFTYYKNPGSVDPSLQSNMNITEVGFETRYARDELFVINDNDRISLGPVRSPSITFRYTIGIKNALNSDFDYHKLELNIVKNQKMGVFGTARFQLSGGYIFGQIPYPLLKNYIGNESPFYISFAYSLMNFSEFTSDQYVAFRYNHNFQGRILNRIPLMNKLKWRLVANANILWGDLRQENLDIIPPKDIFGARVYPFKWLESNVPYVELGYGVENIFKVGRVDFFHRLTYRDDPRVNDFGIKISFQFVL